MNEQTKFEKFKSGLLNSIGFIIVAVVVVIFLVRNFVEIGETGKTVAQIIADGVFALVFGWGIKVLLGYQGILSGMQNQLMQNTVAQHSIAVTNAEPYFTQLGKFCDVQNAKYRIHKRSQVLAAQLLKYEDVFCDDNTRIEQIIAERQDNADGRSIINDGSLKTKIELHKIARRKTRIRKDIMRCVRKANHIKFVELSENELTTDSGNAQEPFKFPQPIAKHITKNAAKVFASALSFAVVLGYFGFKLIEEPSWATFIGGLVQIGVFLIMGSLQFLKEYIYIIDTYRKGIVRKVDLLKQFTKEASENVEFVVPQEIIHIKGIE